MSEKWIWDFVFRKTEFLVSFLGCVRFFWPQNASRMQVADLATAFGRSHELPFAALSDRHSLGTWCKASPLQSPAVNAIGLETNPKMHSTLVVKDSNAPPTFWGRIHLIPAKKIGAHSAFWNVVRCVFFTESVVLRGVSTMPFPPKFSVNYSWKTE